MSAADNFFDTNVLLYLLSADEVKASRAEELLADGGTISVQVLNEFASVASRKLRMPWVEITDLLTQIRAVCDVQPLTTQTHEQALQLAQRHGVSFYDASILAAALLAGCQTVWTEDMQDGQLIQGKLSVRNPFAVGCQ